MRSRRACRLAAPLWALRQLPISAPWMRTGTHQVICVPDGVQGSSPQNTPRQHIDCSEVKRLEKQLVQKVYSGLLLFPLKAENKSPRGNTLPVPGGRETSLWPKRETKG